MSIFPKTFDDFQAIGLKDLDSITGGRCITKAEWADLTEIIRRGKEKSNMLKAQGRYDEAKEFENTFIKMTTKYLDDIAAAPEGSPEVFFSTIFEPYL